MIHDMFITKTGILTHGKLKVTKYHLSGESNQTSEGDPDYFTNLPEIVKESMIHNCDVRIAIAEDGLRYVAKGPTIEEPLIQFLLDNQADVRSQL